MRRNKGDNRDRGDRDRGSAESLVLRPRGSSGIRILGRARCSAYKSISTNQKAAEFERHKLCATGFRHGVGIVYITWPGGADIKGNVCATRYDWHFGLNMRH